MTQTMSPWVQRAERFSELAQDAASAGDHAVMIAAISAAAQCLQIARNLETTEKLLTEIPIRAALEE